MNAHIVHQWECSVEGCESTYRIRNGICCKHAARFKRNGTFDTVRHGLKTDDLLGAQEWIRKNTIINPENGCWEWKRCRNHKGYGHFHWGKIQIASRAAAVAFLGFDASSKLLVCHKCDNPPCCNPDHLFIGTHRDNMRDMERKGRSNKNRGNEHHLCKYTEKSVIKLREMVRHGSKIKEAAKALGIGKSSAYMIIRRKIWTHV